MSMRNEPSNRCHGAVQTGKMQGVAMSCMECTAGQHTSYPLPFAAASEWLHRCCSLSAALLEPVCRGSNSPLGFANLQGME